MKQSWIKDKQLILVKSSVEDFKFPEANLVIATKFSLSYRCNPNKIDKVFLKVKNSLLPNGVFVCSLLSPCGNPIKNKNLREKGAWLTTKNVVDAVVKSIDFPKCWVTLDTTTSLFDLCWVDVLAFNEKKDEEKDKKGSTRK